MDNLGIILIIIIPLIAQFYISYSYRKYSNIQSINKQTGYDIARKILDRNELNDMLIVETRGTLTDHYDPKRKVIRLSSDVYHGTSVASIAVAAHETGHAIQDKESYMFLKIRSIMFPLVKLSSQFSYIAIIIGFLSESFDLIHLGIALLVIGLIFELVTLPVEFNASARALEELKASSLSNSNEITMAKSMLTAAALTYVASVLTSILEILRLINLIRED